MEDPLGLSSRFQILAIKQFFYVRMALNGRSLSERGTRTRPMFVCVSLLGRGLYVEVLGLNC